MFLILPILAVITTQTNFPLDSDKRDDVTRHSNLQISIFWAFLLL